MPATEDNVSAPLISIIVPCLNEQKTIVPTLSQLLRTGPDVELIIVDGGSTDNTLTLLDNPRVRLLQTRKGRGHQLDFGARAAQGKLLWFLHADTLINAEAEAELRRALMHPSFCSGNFSLIFDGPTRDAKVMTWIYRHLRLIGLAYGDSGYAVRTEVYHRVGGFRDFPIFEDLDLLRRLRRVGNFVRFPATVTTSSRRLEKPGLPRMFAYWTFLQVLYWLGCDPRRLEKLYREVR